MAKKHYNQTIGFADRLNQAMYDKDMNATQLARLVGVDRKTVYMWQWGDTMPNALILARICKVLSVSADYLLFGSGGGKTILAPKEEYIYLPTKNGPLRMKRYSKPLPTKDGYIQFEYRRVEYETVL